VSRIQVSPSAVALGQYPYSVYCPALGPYLPGNPDGPEPNMAAGPSH